MLTVVCRPLSGVMTWNDRPDGSDEGAGDRGFTLDATVTGVGSGVTGNRARLRKVLADPQVSGIVVEHATGVPGSVSSTGQQQSRPRAAGSSW